MTPEHGQYVYQKLMPFPPESIFDIFNVIWITPIQKLGQNRENDKKILKNAFYLYLDGTDQNQKICFCPFIVYSHEIKMFPCLKIIKGHILLQFKHIKPIWVKIK